MGLIGKGVGFALLALVTNMGYKFYKVAKGSVQSPGTAYMAHLAKLRQETSAIDASIKKHKFLVIGGTGFTGSAIVNDLLARGAQQVRVMGRSLPPSVEYPYQDQKYPLPGVDYVKADVTSKEGLRKAMDGISVVIHTAAHYGSPMFNTRGAGTSTEKVNYGGMQNIVAVAKEKGVKQLVYTCTSDVTFTPAGYTNASEDTQPYADGKDAPAIGDHYARTKILAEKHCLKSDSKKDGLRTISLRPNGIYGPGENSAFPKAVAPAYIMGLMPMIFDTEQRSDWVCVYNLVYAHMLAVHRLETAPEEVAGRPFYITDQKDINNAAYKVFERPMNMVGAEVRHWIIVPPWAFIKAAGWMMDAHVWCADKLGFDLFGHFAPVMFTEKEAYKAVVTHTHNPQASQKRLTYHALMDYHTCASFQGEELQRRWGLKEQVTKW